MNIWLSLLVSLILTTSVAFAFPIILLTSLLAGLGILSHVSLIAPWVHEIYSQIWSFLAIFGDGSGIFGILTLAFACGVAGFLFESLNFYRYRLLINQSRQQPWQKVKPIEVISKILYTPDQK